MPTIGPCPPPKDVAVPVVPPIPAVPVAFPPIADPPIAEPPIGEPPIGDPVEDPPKPDPDPNPDPEPKLDPEPRLDDPKLDPEPSPDPGCPPIGDVAPPVPAVLPDIPGPLALLESAATGTPLASFVTFVPASGAYMPPIMLPMATAAIAPFAPAVSGWPKKPSGRTCAFP